MKTKNLKIITILVVIGLLTIQSLIWLNQDKKLVDNTTKEYFNLDSSGYILKTKFNIPEEFHFKYAAFRVLRTQDTLQRGFFPFIIQKRGLVIENSIVKEELKE